MKYQIILAGVGGQGVLFASKLITGMAQQRALPVLSSQTIGMSQRGGSVMTHLKIGDFESPLVREGDANLLMAFDPTEAHRRLQFLRRSCNGERAACVVNAPDATAFPDPRVSGLLADMNVDVHICPADEVALDMKSPLVANLVLLGFCVSRGAIPFDFDELRTVTSAVSEKQHRELNLAALERGRILRTM